MLPTVTFAGSRMPAIARAIKQSEPIVAGTRQRILDTAERLFADEGPAAVTLRSIAAAADVNVAGVNYHFGSKEKLFEEMFLRRIAPLNEERLIRLAACAAKAGGKPTLPAIVTAYVTPAMALPQIDQMLVRYYDRVRAAFVAALHQAAPHLTEQEVVWRYYWMGGSVMVSLAVPPGMAARAEGMIARELIG